MRMQDTVLSAIPSAVNQPDDQDLQLGRAYGFTWA